jgi:neurofibromin 1
MSLDDTNQLQVTSTAKVRDSYPDESYTLLKPLESTASSDVLYSILTFLDASPLTLYAGAPHNVSGWMRFFEDTLGNFVQYLVSDDDRIRYMASAVSRKLLITGTRSIKQRSESLELKSYGHNFWKST